MEIQLTVVELDLVKFSIPSSELHKYGGVKATNVLYEDIEKIVIEASKSFKYHTIMSLVRRFRDSLTRSQAEPGNAIQEAPAS